MKHFIPRSDASFDEWVQVFVNFVQPRLEDYGFTEDDFQEIADLAPEWAERLNAHNTAQAAARAATISKTQTRQKLEKSVREFVNRLQSNPLVPQPDRAAMGVADRNGHTRARIPAPSAPPIPMIENGIRAAHSIKFISEDTFSTRKAKPEGVHGCEIWVAIGDVPTSQADFEFVGTATRMPYVVNHKWSDVGKTAYYKLRYVSTRNEPGPWSRVSSATIAA